MVVAKPVEGGDRLGRVLLPVVVDEGEPFALAGHLLLGEVVVLHVFERLDTLMAAVSSSILLSGMLSPILDLAVLLSSPPRFEMFFKFFKFVELSDSSAAQLLVFTYCDKPAIRWPCIIRRPYSFVRTQTQLSRGLNSTPPTLPFPSG